VIYVTERETGADQFHGRLTIGRPVKPTPEQMERAATALVPYVNEWDLPLNPEDLYELAGAVLTHFDGTATLDEIERAERARIAQRRAT
jgi:hypothetical protein